MRKACYLVMIIAVTMLLAAGYGYADENNKEETNFFPLNNGNVWKYVVHYRGVNDNSRDADIRRTTSVIGKEELHGQEAFVVDHVVDSLNNFLEKKDYLLKEKNKIIRSKTLLYSIADRDLKYGLETKEKKGDIIEIEDTSVPEVVMVLPLKEGLKWVSQGVTYSVLGKTKLSVPAGTFECLKVKSDFPGGSVYSYYANNVGLVRQDTYEDRAKGKLIQPTILELENYHLEK